MHALRAASLVVLVGILALVAVYGPAAGLIVVAGLAAIALAYRCPEYALAFGAAASLAGGSYGFVALRGGVILIVGASASAFAMLARRTVGRLAAAPHPRSHPRLAGSAGRGRGGRRSS